LNGTGKQVMVVLKVDSTHDMKVVSNKEVPEMQRMCAFSHLGFSKVFVQEGEKLKCKVMNAANDEATLVDDGEIDLLPGEQFVAVSNGVICLSKSGKIRTLTYD